MASIEQIAELIKDCWAYFKTTAPPPKTIDSWTDELRDLDLWNSGSWIRHKFKGLDTWPANYPKTIRTFYREWRLSQPKEADADQGCPQCLDGLLHAVKDGNVYAFRCAVCKTADLPYPFSTNAWLNDNGYRLDWPPGYQGGVDRPRLSKFKRDFGNLDDIPF